MSARFLLTVLGVLALTGCVSVVKVKPAGDQTAGIRYYLPQVFLQVTPASDGTITVEKLYLPDKKHEYAISADSYLSSHKLEVDRDEKGFLKSVTFDSDGTALGQQVASSAAAIRAAQIDQKVAKAKADADQAKAAADKAKSALDAADAARKSAGTTLVVAQRKVDFLQQLKNPPKDIDDQILEAQLAVVEAQAKKDAAEAAYSALLTSTQVPAIAANAANAGKAAGWPQAFEPVFYRVDMSSTSVTLKEAFPQSTRATFVMPKTEKAAPELAVYPESIAMRPTGKDGILSKGVQLNQEVKAVALKSFVRSDGSVPSDQPILSLQLGGTAVQIEIPKKTQPGHYELDIGITPQDAKAGDPPIKRTVKIWIEK